MNWNQSQFWREHLPKPEVVCAAARDFAREGAIIFADGNRATMLADGSSQAEIELQVRDYEALLLSCYMLGVTEYAKAVTTGEFRREPWRDDPSEPDGAEVRIFENWYDSLPETPALIPESDAAAFSPRQETSRLMELYRAQPCEAYGRSLFSSLLRWPAADCWQHLGLHMAVYHETSKYLAPGALLRGYLWLVATFKSETSPTWNDYYAARWLFSADPAHIIELHRRVHLTGKKWADVARSAAWCVNSLRTQSPDFDLSYRKVVHCATCPGDAVPGHPRDPLAAKFGL